MEDHVGPAGDVNDIQAAKDWNRLKEDATLATQDEHNTSFLEGCRRYPKAAAWSCLVTMCIIMDGYDQALISGFFAFPAFTKHYGHELRDHPGRYVMYGPWQMALGFAAPVGNMFGIYLNGWLVDKMGHKKALHVGLFIICGLIFIQFFAKNVETLFVGQILLGVPWGIFATLAPSFASEVAPLVLRSYLETWVVTCWGIGQFFSYAVLFTLNTNLSEWAYRIPFAVQWVWPVAILPFALFVPESPWWLVRKGRIEQAEKSVMRLTSAPTKEIQTENAKKAVALMIETNKLEQDLDDDISWTACFKGTDLRRTEISAFTWASQVLTGFVIQGYSTFFFQQAGLSPNDSFKMTLGVGGVHLLGNLLSMTLTGNYGRRTLWLWGCAVEAVLMFAMGFVAIPKQSTAFGFATSALYILWFGIWCLTLGPLPYIINGEVSATRLRTKTIAVSRAAYQVLGIINSIVTPYLLNPEYANLKGKVALITASFTVVTFIWAWFRLPETGGRTYEELDILFNEKGLKARQFRHVVIHREGDTIRVEGPHNTPN